MGIFEETLRDSKIIADELSQFSIKMQQASEALRFNNHVICHSIFNQMATIIGKLEEVKFVCNRLTDLSIENLQKRKD